jgi:hypothetical protein
MSSRKPWQHRLQALREQLGQCRSRIRKNVLRAQANLPKSMFDASETLVQFAEKSIHRVLEELKWLIP